MIFIIARHLLPGSSLFDHKAMIEQRDRLGIPHEMERGAMVGRLEGIAFDLGFAHTEMERFRHSMRPRPQRMIDVSVRGSSTQAS
jgi:hypothetical protein